jgi:HPt (histidine-containing phosphotransfer) domain-containing protein
MSENKSNDTRKNDNPGGGTADDDKRFASAPVDVKRLAMISGGKPDFLRRVFQIFVVDTQRRMDRIRRALEAGDWESVATEAHTLKGAFGNMGAWDLRDAALDLERHAQNKSKDDCPRSLEEMAAEYERAREFLSAQVASH